VEYVYGKKIDSRDEEIKYLVKWAGFKKSDSTWEPYDHLAAVQSTIKEYDLIQSRQLFLEKYLNKPIEKLIKQALPQTKLPINELTFEERIKENKEIEEKAEFGDFQKNAPKNIIKHREGKLEKKTNISSVFYKVEWEEEEGGFIPRSRYFSIEDLKLYCPLLLIQYLEKNVVFIEKNHMK